MLMFMYLTSCTEILYFKNNFWNEEFFGMSTMASNENKLETIIVKREVSS